MMNKAASSTKPVISVAVVGHVDAGKSTLMGHLFCKLGKISEHELNKLRLKTKEHNKATFEYAYALDKNEAEMSAGVTITNKTESFQTDNYRVTIVDCPGHINYVKNMISGASQADHAFLVVNAFAGIEQQTRQHAGIIAFMSVTSVLVVVNKMDLSTVNYSETRFLEVCAEVKKMMNSHGFYTDEDRQALLAGLSPEERQKKSMRIRGKLRFIPCSGYLGQNLFAPSQKLSWWNGPTLYQAIDRLELPPNLKDQPLRIQISQINQKTGLPPIWCGKVLAGTVAPGTKVLVKPGTKEPKVGEVKSIEMHHQVLSSATAGDNIGMIIRGFARDDAKKGHVLSGIEDTPVICTAIKGTMMVQDRRSRVGLGSQYNMAYGTATVSVLVQKIHSIRKLGGQMLDEARIDQLVRSGDPDHHVVVSYGETAVVTLRPEKTIAIETANKSRTLGRVILRTDTIVAFCAISELTQHPDEAATADIIRRSRL